jgi:hypothetical protein
MLHLRCADLIDQAYGTIRIAVRIDEFLQRIGTDILVT